MGVQIQFDASTVKANLRKLKERGQMAETTSTKDLAYEILRLASERVPHDKGTLQNSGTVQQIGRSIFVGFNMVYAAYLHEHPEFNFREGRQGKYLENAIRENKDSLGLDYAQSVKKELFQ